MGGIRTEVEEWEKKLSLLSDMLDEWLTCQRSWMYLENIFGAEGESFLLSINAVHHALALPDKDDRVLSPCST